MDGGICLKASPRQSNEEEAEKFGGQTMATAAAAVIWSRIACKSLWQEASGALGDLGTFVPVVVALGLVNGLDLGTSLIATGICNVVTGLVFGVPMPVQPMKAVAAVALTEGNPLTMEEIMAAGICVSGITLLFAVTGMVRLVARCVPLPVVRGIQLAQGLSFGIKAVKFIVKDEHLSSDTGRRKRPWFGFDSILLALCAIGFILLASGTGDDERQEQQDGGDHASSQACQQQQSGKLQDGDVERVAEEADSSIVLRRTLPIPSALIVFAVGILITFVRRPGIVKHLSFGPARPRLSRISLADWKSGFLRAAIPQLPLTLLNSVVAVCKLSKDLFPGSRDKVSPTRISISVGLMNLVGCWFGALPVCHGAGGLAGQYRFGARSGIAVVMLGVTKLVLGLVLGSSLISILSAFPVSLLGVLLLFSGVELAMACRDQGSRFDSFVMLVCVVVSLTTKLAIGCVCAIVVFAVLRLRLVLISVKTSNLLVLRK